MANTTIIHVPVQSVNGLTGTIVLNSTSIGAAPLMHTHTENDITDLGNYIVDAPSDGKRYGRRNAVWSEIESSTGIEEVPVGAYSYVRKYGQWTRPRIISSGVSSTTIGIQVEGSDISDQYSIPSATSSSAGLMNASDKEKLNGLVNISNTDSLSEGAINKYYTDSRVSLNTSVVANTNKVGIPIGGTTGQVLSKNTSSNYDVTWTTPSGGATGTNLSITHNASTVNINSSTGSDVILNAATISLAGAMTSSDKVKLTNVSTYTRSSTVKSFLPSETNEDIRDYFNALDSNLNDKILNINFGTGTRTFKGAGLTREFLNLSKFYNGIVIIDLSTLSGFTFNSGGTVFMVLPNKECEVVIKLGSYTANINIDTANNNECVIFGTDTSTSVGRSVTIIGDTSSTSIINLTLSSIEKYKLLKGHFNNINFNNFSIQRTTVADTTSGYIIAGSLSFEANHNINIYMSNIEVSGGLTVMYSQGISYASNIVFARVDTFNIVGITIPSSNQYNFVTNF